MPEEAVTIHDVARAAGVSIGTVSKALNRQGQLTPQTRDRVMQAAERLQFRPNALATDLRSIRHAGATSRLHRFSNVLALLSDQPGMDVSALSLDGPIPDLALPDTYHSVSRFMLNKGPA